LKVRQPETSKYVLGSVLIVAMLIGGGTTRGLYTDTIIFCLTLVATGLVFVASPERRIGSDLLALPALIILLCLLQLMPLPAGMLAWLRPEVLEPPEGTRGAIDFISLGVGQSLESLLLVLAPVAFFLSILRLRSDQVAPLLPFFFLGLFCNLLVGALQYSLSANGDVVDILPYGIQGGLFANANHFSTLLFISIPLIVYFGLYKHQRMLSILGVAAVLLILLAANSRAGVLFGLAVTAASLIAVPGRSRITLAAMIAAFVGLSIYSVGALSKIDPENLDQQFGRVEFARTTLDGIRDNWPLGVGFGNFVNAYQVYEKPEMIFREYVNHAHNDYLELVFEGGVLAAALIGLYLFLLMKAAFSRESDPLKRAALISIVFVLAHSLVDYPLRTLAIAMSFALLNGIFFHRGSRRSARVRRELVEVEHNGKQLLVPVAGEATGT
jgi:O-antigen ligase